MSKVFKLKNIITKAESIINEMNVRAAEKWHPEKEIVAMYTSCPPTVTYHCPSFVVDIFLNGYEEGKKPTYSFAIYNEKYALFEKISDGEGKGRKTEITFEKMIEMLELISHGESFEE